MSVQMVSGPNTRAGRPMTAFSGVYVGLEENREKSVFVPLMNRNDGTHIQRDLHTEEGVTEMDASPDTEVVVVVTTSVVVVVVVSSVVVVVVVSSVVVVVVVSSTHSVWHPRQSPPKPGSCKSINWHAPLSPRG
jgi:hypothetical protein